ncbi:hypothetical protein U1Q18_003439 [Sarracenia purpurea var. burkii]
MLNWCLWIIALVTEDRDYAQSVSLDHLMAMVGGICHWEQLVTMSLMEQSRLDFERDEVVSRASLCVDLFLEAAFLWRVLLSNVESRVLVISLVDSSWPLAAAK